MTATTSRTGTPVTLTTADGQSHSFILTPSCHAGWLAVNAYLLSVLSADDWDALLADHGHVLTMARGPFDVHADKARSYGLTVDDACFLHTVAGCIVEKQEPGQHIAVHWYGTESALMDAWVALSQLAGWQYASPF